MALMILRWKPCRLFSGRAGERLALLRASTQPFPGGSYLAALLQACGPASPHQGGEARKNLNGLKRAPMPRDRAVKSGPFFLDLRLEN